MKLNLFLCFLLVYFSLCVSSPFSSNNSYFRKQLKNVHTIIENLLHLIPETKPMDCEEIMEKGMNTSGIYLVEPLNRRNQPRIFPVYCDMITDGGGWTVFQRRGEFKNIVFYFYKNWKNYSDGFGSLEKEFWLGNEKLHSLTNQANYSLRIDMKDMEGIHRYAQYEEFRIGSRDDYYRLHVNGYSGNAKDSLSYHDGMKFTTFDKDNDNHGRNCAELSRGAWWYDSCLYSNLNGLNLKGQHEDPFKGIQWYFWKGASYSLPFVEMKIRTN